jgi:hypothetical protein
MKCGLLEEKLLVFGDQVARKISGQKKNEVSPLGSNEEFHDYTAIQC